MLLLFSFVIFVFSFHFISFSPSAYYRSREEWDAIIVSCGFLKGERERERERKRKR